MSSIVADPVYSVRSVSSLVAVEGVCAMLLYQYGRVLSSRPGDTVYSATLWLLHPPPSAACLRPGRSCNFMVAALGVCADYVPWLFDVSLVASTSPREPVGGRESGASAMTARSPAAGQGPSAAARSRISPCPHARYGIQEWPPGSPAFGD
jgi:hypothetical protein